MSTPSFVYISASRRERDLFERDLEYERIPPFKSSLNEDDFRNDYGLFGYRSDIIDVHRSDQQRLSPNAEYQGNCKPADIKSESAFPRNSPPSNVNGLHASWGFITGGMKRGSGFNYGSTHDNTIYSQTSNMPTFMESSHGVSHNHLYQGYSNQQNHPGSMSVGVSAQAIGVAHQAQYLQPGQSANQRVPISHTTRASPMTVQWLIENYETADGVSLPRSTLYSHYLRHCSESKIDAVNAASFGKLIRSVFLGLKTRRLGTRGNSKYHYYGIRVKPNSPLSRLTDDTQVALRAQPVASKRTIGSASYDQTGARVEATSTNNEGMTAASYQQYLGDTSEGLPEVPAIDLTESLPEGVSKLDVTSFGNYYRSHCEALLEVISNLQFDLVEALWQAFYRSPAAADKTDNGTLESHDYSISKTMLIVLCKYKPMQEFIKETDYLLYQKLVTLLVPDVLRAVPSTLTQAIRNFAKSLENMLIGSMSEMPKEIVNIKVAAASAFSQTLRRYTSLNHLAQAARAVLQNPQQINQMWSDLNKVDFNNVQEQSSWVCQCDEALIQKLEEDFKRTLSQQQSLEEWAQWLESVVSMVLEQHQGRDSYPKAARQFLLNWSFYSSMIIRDLTLRSAASFGSFHLIRLLYDEYMFYLIENKVAAHTGKSPLSVMAECVNNSMLHSFNDDDDDGESSNDEGSASPPHAQSRSVDLSESILSQTLVRNDEPPLKRTK
nr:DNA-binding protein RFX2 isoform X2 [Hydra vulgaris]